MKHIATGLACLALLLTFSTADAAKKAPQESKTVEAGTTYIANVTGIS